MRKVTWRNLLARKVRLALSAFAIVLGVAFVAGSLIFTDALGGAFDGIINGTTPEVQGRTVRCRKRHRRGRTPGPCPPICCRPWKGYQGRLGRGEADQVQGVYVIGSDGKVVTHGGAPGFAFNYTDTKAISGDQIITLSQGDLPVGGSEIAMDEKTADDAGYTIGDEVRLVTPAADPAMTAELTGLTKFGSEGGLAGATITVIDRPADARPVLPWSRRLQLDRPVDGRTASPSPSCATRLQTSYPQGIEARTGDALAEEGKDDIGEALSFINGLPARLRRRSRWWSVRSFIVNTFSILVAQRSRELALLRAHGCHEATGHPVRARRGVRDRPDRVDGWTCRGLSARARPEGAVRALRLRPGRGDVLHRAAHLRSGRRRWCAGDDAGGVPPGKAGQQDLPRCRPCGTTSLCPRRRSTAGSWSVSRWWLGGAGMIAAGFVVKGSMGLLVLGLGMLGDPRRGLVDEPRGRSSGHLAAGCDLPAAVRCSGGPRHPRTPFRNPRRTAATSGRADDRPDLGGADVDPRDSRPRRAPTRPSPTP